VVLGAVPAFGFVPAVLAAAGGHFAVDEQLGPQGSVLFAPLVVEVPYETVDDAVVAGVEGAAVPTVGQPTLVGGTRVLRTVACAGSEADLVHQLPVFRKEAVLVPAES